MRRTSLLLVLVCGLLNTQAAEQKTGADAGAMCYINKPFTPKDLVAQVREFLGE